VGIVRLHLDFETFSEADLTVVGAYKYAQCPTTDCLLASGLVEGERKLRRWRPGWDYPYDDIDPRDIEIHAWNSQFERLVWNHIMVPRYGWPKLKRHQFVCVSAQARSTAAGPAKLDTAGHFFRRKHTKDNKGHLHMLKMCRPATEKQQLDWVKAHPAFFTPRPQERAAKLAYENAAKRAHHTMEAIDRLHDYCDQDVWTEYDIARILPPWEAPELEAFWESERINDHGIVVDVDFARAACAYAEDEKAYFARRIVELTDGAVETPRQFERIKAWALPRMSDEAKEICKWYDNGVPKYSLDADTRANLLTECSIDAYFLDEDVQEFIEVLDMAGKSTIAKYQAIVDRAVWHEAEGVWRVHGLYMFAGAAQSGRYSSTGIQMHNMVRNVPANAPALIKAFKKDKGVMREVEAWADGVNAKKKPEQRRTLAEPVHALGQLVRPTITGCPHDDFDLAWCDWSSIEACVLPWLALDSRAEDRLALFRRGEDIYLKTASELCGRKITKADEFERQAFGKVPELSLGYAGGAGAFAAMAKNYGVSLPEAQVQKIVRDWREANPWAADREDGFWVRLERAAMLAIERPGASYAAGRVNYLYDPDALDGIGALWAELPSGRRLCYPDARIQVVTTKWGEDKLGITAMKGSWRPKKGETEWPRVSVWPGLLAENCIAHGTEVLTNHGWTAIQNVRADALLWDGAAWVRHDGLISKGVQACMTQYGVRMTPDHKVLTNDGWRTASEAQRGGYDRCAVWLPDGRAARPQTRKIGLLADALRLWRGSGAQRSRRKEGQHAILRVQAGCAPGGNTRHARHERAPGIRGVAVHARSLPVAFASGMAQLRRAWNSGVRALANQLRKFLGGHGAGVSARAYAGPQGQQWSLHAIELPMGHEPRASEQHRFQPNSGDAGRRDDSGASQPPLRGEAEHNPIPAGTWMAGHQGGDDTTKLPEFPVYDLMNAGPRQRFVVRGTDGPVIVHNCTQAVATGDLLNEALLRAADMGLRVCAHTHDEIMIETPEPERDAERLKACMLEKPRWPGADALPLRADVGFGYRYKVKF